jgi:hypothetical protein
MIAMTKVAREQTKKRKTGKYLGYREPFQKRIFEKERNDAVQE